MVLYCTGSVCERRVGEYRLDVREGTGVVRLATERVKVNAKRGGEGHLSSSGIWLRGGNTAPYTPPNFKTKPLLFHPFVWQFFHGLFVSLRLAAKTSR